MALDPELLQKLRAENPRGIRTFDLSDGRTFVFRRASRIEYTAFKAQCMQVQSNPMVAANAATVLAQSLRLHPDNAEFQAFCESDPDVVDEFGVFLAGDVGSGVKIVAGKAGT